MGEPSEVSKPLKGVLIVIALLLVASLIIGGWLACRAWQNPVDSTRDGYNARPNGEAVTAPAE